MIDNEKHRKFVRIETKGLKFPKIRLYINFPCAIFSIIFFVILSSCNDNTNNFNKCFDKGAVLLGLENYDNAITEFNKAIEINPKSYEAYRYKSFAYYALDDLKLAEISINKSLELNKDIVNIESLLLKGGIREELNDTLGALYWYSKTIILDSNFVDGLCQRGWLATRFKDYQLAYDDFKRINDIDSSSEEINTILLNLKQENYKYFEIKNHIKFFNYYPKVKK